MKKENKLENGNGSDASTCYLINIDITREELKALQYLTEKARVGAELKGDTGEVSRLKARAVKLALAIESKGCSEVDQALLEVEKWKKLTIPYLAIHAGIYGRDRYGEGCLHYTHYDILEEAGAKMDCFKRRGFPAEDNVKALASATESELRRRG